MNTIQQFFNLTSNKEALCINNIYTFLCKNIINKNFIITEPEISIIFNYLESTNNTDTYSKNLWNKFSIQKEIFDSTIFIYNLLKTSEYSTLNKNILPLLKNNNFSEIVINTINSSFNNIYHIYLNALYISLDKTHHSFQDKNFEFYLTPPDANHFTKSSYFIEDCYSFRFILDGSVKYRNNIFCSKGDLLISDKNIFLEDYSILTPTYSEIIFIIKPEFISKLGINIPKFKLKKLPFCFNQGLLNFILNKTPITPNNYFNLEVLAIYLLNLILNPHMEFLDKNSINFKNNITKTISNNITLNDSEINILISQKLDISMSKLYQLFKKFFNSTPSKVIKTLKLDYACFLLISTEKTIEEISYLVGYNESTFYKKFNSSLGMSPSTFKKQNNY